MVLLGVVVALGVTNDSYGLPPCPYWPGMTEDDKTVFIACRCVGALIGALFDYSLMTLHTPFPIRLQHLERNGREPLQYEYTSNGDVDFEA